MLPIRMRKIQQKGELMPTITEIKNPNLTLCKLNPYDDTDEYCLCPKCAKTQYCQGCDLCSRALRDPEPAKKCIGFEKRN